MMDKQRKNRLVSVQILALPWFHIGAEDVEEGEGEADVTDTAGIALWAQPRGSFSKSADEPGTIPLHTVLGAQSQDVVCAPVSEPAASDAHVTWQQPPVSLDRPLITSLHHGPPPLQDNARHVACVDRAILQLKSLIHSRYRNTRQAFRIFDKDHKGALTPLNFSNGMLAHGLDLSGPELDMAWKKFDRDRSGKITFPDFLSVIGE